MHVIIMMINIIEIIGMQVIPIGLVLVSELPSLHSMCTIGMLHCMIYPTPGLYPMHFSQGTDVVR